MRINETFSRIIDGLGLCYGLANIQEVLGIIVMALTVFNILSAYIFKLIDKIKRKKYEEISEDTKNAIEELERLRALLKEKNKESE